MQNRYKKKVKRISLKTRFLILLGGILMVTGLWATAAYREEIDFFSALAYRDWISAREVYLRAGDTEPTRLERAQMQLAMHEFVFCARQNFTILTPDYEVLSVDALEDDNGLAMSALIIHDRASIEWTVYIPVAGFYHLEFVYRPLPGRGTAIERRFAINGQVHYREAMFLNLPRIWADRPNPCGNRIAEDALGHDIRPAQEERNVWRRQAFYDHMGFYNEPLKHWFHEGYNTIWLGGAREPFALHSIIVGYVLPAESHAMVFHQHRAEGAQGVFGGNDEIIFIQAQHYHEKSEFTIYATPDRSSPLTYPQHPSFLRMNALGGERWRFPHQWVTWRVYVPQAGFYRMGIRYIQNFALADGRFVNRRLLINDEVPFYEANFLQFNFEQTWQILVPGDDHGDFLFYFQQGWNYITLDVVLGNLSGLVSQMDSMVLEMTAILRAITMIMGENPDYHRDYFFDIILAEELVALARLSEELREMRIYIEDITGQSGADLNFMDQFALLLFRMADDHNLIAELFNNFRDQVAAFSDVSMRMQLQPLMLDWIALIPLDADVPRAEARWWQVLWFEIRAFIASFFVDFNSMGSEVTTAQLRDNPDLRVLEMWQTMGRDQLHIFRAMMNETFTPVYDIHVDARLVAGGFDMAVLAGIGPDLSLGGDPIGMGIRNALIELNDMPGFDEVVARFHPSTMVNQGIYRGRADGQRTYWSIPDTMGFGMMFYRRDILRELGVEPPRTWDDYYRLFPLLTRYNMTMSAPGFDLLVMQHGGRMFCYCYARWVVDSDMHMDLFAEAANFHNIWRVPVEMNAGNRFRTGLLPIMFGDYAGTFGGIVLESPELRGLWGMVPMPGVRTQVFEYVICPIAGTRQHRILTTTGVPTGHYAPIREDADGNLYYINHTVGAGGGSNVIPWHSRDPEAAWQFFVWFTGMEAQIRWAQEMVALLGPAARHPTANLEALAAMPWSYEEFRAIDLAMTMLYAYQGVPGGYYIGRHLGFAWATAIGAYADTESLLRHILPAQREMTRRRDEFHFHVDCVCDYEPPPFIPRTERF